MFCLCLRYSTRSIRYIETCPGIPTLRVRTFTQLYEFREEESALNFKRINATSNLTKTLVSPKLFSYNMMLMDL